MEESVSWKVCGKRTGVAVVDQTWWACGKGMILGGAAEALAALSGELIPGEYELQDNSYMHICLQHTGGSCIVIYRVGGEASLSRDLRGHMVRLIRVEGGGGVERGGNREVYQKVGDSGSDYASLAGGGGPWWRGVRSMDTEAGSTDALNAVWWWWYGVVDGGGKWFRVEGGGE
ncbi:hypothetical protein Acr_10g0010450 [Actinidia rufa]|uniref:Uncharacterized protein n=1 Tax=Actinidia rufa TaxID=165716 RepID=A0A7J0FAE2_9ERIC|nr:hypothetical protein Acr_10g0010450 [Actinidia rufa]